MTTRRAAGPGRGLTLVELLVVIAVVAVTLTLAAPSFRDAIEQRRLRGTHDQLITDLQFARSEAASRQQGVIVSFRKSASRTCYTIHTCAQPPCNCDCNTGVGSACPTPSGVAPPVEIRTVRFALSEGVQVDSYDKFDPGVEPTFASRTDLRFDPTTGGTSWDVVEAGPGAVPLIVPTMIGMLRTHLTRNGMALNTDVSYMGRPSTCSPLGKVSGFRAC